MNCETCQFSGKTKLQRVNNSFDIRKMIKINQEENNITFKLIPSDKSLITRLLHSKEKIIPPNLEYIEINKILKNAHFEYLKKKASLICQDINTFN